MTFKIFQRKILNTPITCIPFEEQIMLILRWAKRPESRNVCLANVHMLMEAYRKPEFAGILNQADLVTPDGMPLVWILRQLGVYNQNQVAGMDVFLSLCELAQQNQLGVYFLGSNDIVLAKVRQKLQKHYPILKISGMEALPLMSVSDIVANKDRELINRINHSDARFVFLCLGCPKQETWMAQYQGELNAVTIGVGAVFSMYADIYPRAPYVVRRIGMEWLYRLFQEPARLWRRYVATIPPFVYLATRQVMGSYGRGLRLEQRTFIENNLVTNFEGWDFTPSKLGDILVKQNLLTSQELDQALRKQKQMPHTKLGEILVLNNQLSLPELRFYLHNQKIKLGEVLVEKKLIKQKKLEEVLGLSRQEKCLLGDFLVREGLISPEELTLALLDYYLRRKGCRLKLDDDWAAFPKSLLKSKVS